MLILKLILTVLGLNFKYSIQAHCKLFLYFQATNNSMSYSGFFFYLWAISGIKHC